MNSKSGWSCRWRFLTQLSSPCTSNLGWGARWGGEGLAPSRVQRAAEARLGSHASLGGFLRNPGLLVRGATGRGPRSRDMCPGHHGIILMNLEVKPKRKGDLRALEQSIPLLAEAAAGPGSPPGSWSRPTPPFIHRNFLVPLLHARLCAGGRQRAGGRWPAGAGHEESGIYLCDQALGLESPRREPDVGVGWLAMLAGRGGRKRAHWS